ncbi:methylene-fatty-acyl-phospholipid synthase [Histoplasma mississippiense (nom. inval.)]|uniref:methylene-fatty-acyl-phospholipid synthase n=1 Tax=Ajellomyces capsulatus (strain NAm1 / WU24) TaxID=2059318 RepID=UPI000157B78B|nr:methylene-fatty-acyl-phospholipid synthase [Histoplasma mississippiense (nom. inval.)]EDN04119.1 methylene-fatty-acyl-phospholipid synthase [Histoplasma mississippiense (nom. inval.)]
MASITDYIDFSQTSLHCPIADAPSTTTVAAAAIAFNPIFWKANLNTHDSIVARQEYRNHFLTRIFGSPYNGCYVLAVAIFSLGILRDHLYNRALADQPLYQPVSQPYLAYGLFTTGNTLVLSSMWALGLTGTYLGDYFGILMDAPVTGFPFNVTGSPMYWGSTLSFLAVALYKGKVAGLLLTLEVFVCYWLALKWEE